MHASHSYIIVTESLENEPVEPTESVEPEANQGKQLSIILYSYLI